MPRAAPFIQIPTYLMLSVELEQAKICGSLSISDHIKLLQAERVGEDAVTEFASAFNELQMRV